MKLTVGQKLWYVRHKWNGSDEGREVVVKLVGRKWFEHSGAWGRFSIATLWGEDRYNGQCWESRAEYELCQELTKLWNALKRDIERTRELPRDLTIESIAEARRLLRIGDAK